MGDIIQIVNNEYISNYKKKCKKTFILYTILAVIVQVAIAFIIHLYTQKLNIMIVILLLLLLVNSITIIKKTIYSKYNELLHQLKSELSKFEDIRESSVYSLFVEDERLKIMFRYKNKDYYLVIDDYAVVIDEIVNKDSAMI